MRIRAHPILDSELQIPVFDGQMIALANECYEDTGVVLTGYGKPDCIGVPLYRQARAIRSVTEATVLMQPFWLRHCSLVTGSRAMSLPSRAQRQTVWMNPCAFHRSRSRHEERTSHVKLLLSSLVVY
jgi:hypothetical protein